MSTPVRPAKGGGEQGKREMRVVLFGNHNLAVNCLHTLVERGHDVVQVYTHGPSKGENVWYRSLHEAAEELGLPVRRLGKIDREALVEQVRSLEPDLIFSLSWRKMLPEEVLQIPRIASINAHGSLLPAYRGRTPVTWVVANGERFTGISFHRMVEAPDAGDVFLQEEIPIDPFMTGGELFKRVTEVGTRLFAVLLEQLEKGTTAPVKQDPSKATYFGGRGPVDDVIDWRRPAETVYNLVRAVTPPYPGAVSLYEGEETRILRALPLSLTLEAGAGEITHLLPEGPTVCCGDGRLLLLLETRQKEGADTLFRAGEYFSSREETIKALGL